ncbi:nitrate reductase [Vibrio mangrovi]|uniref:Nitrate reductase n=1 Tax=Vibrio mangrovi TaxID=474394 RepID=A0A1Y6IS10_9VIBR|nr:nitrate reductase [Vibrio mangrovi]MDW6004348.1 nitrate reductase [Vibrio mangrovi]SMR98853.1 Nitrate reductase [Vibrio mangrovi]
MQKEGIQSTCPYCGVGCGVLTQGQQIIGDPNHPANCGALCVKGSALQESLVTPARLLYPKMGKSEISWQQATHEIATRIHTSVQHYGPDSVAMYVSGQLLTEDYYVANKLMKGYVGSANIDTNSRLCMSSAVAAHVRAFGEDVVPVNYEDIDDADLLVLVGANSAWTHPVLFRRIQQAKQRNPDLKMIVIDPRKTVTAEQADLHIPLANDGDVLLFNGLCRYLLDRQLTDASFVRQHTQGLDALCAELSHHRYQPEQVAGALNIPQSVVDKFYQWFAESTHVMTLFCQGINQSQSGVDKGNAIINTHLLSGKICRPGCGPFSLTGQPNAMGGREVGGLANQLAVHRGFDDESIARVQQFWNSPVIATQPGLKAVELFRAVARGDIKVLWIMATNPLVSMPDSDFIRQALKQCEFVIVSDMTSGTDTAADADLLLPAAGWGEKQGMVTNSERCLSRQRRFLNTPGEVRPDWWAVSQVGQQLCELMDVSNGFDFLSENDIFREYAALTEINRGTRYQLELSALAALSDAELEQWQPTRWPLDRSHPYQNRHFSTEDGRANLVVTPAPDIQPSSGWWLNTGRQRDQWHTMTRTGHVAKLAAGELEPTLYMNSGSAKALGLQEHTMARLSMSGEAWIWGKVAIDEGLQPRQLFMSMHWAGDYGGASQVNRVVRADYDPLSGQPAFKSGSVMIQPAPVTHYGLTVGHAHSMPVCEYLSMQREKKATVWRFATSERLCKTVPDVKSGERVLTLDQEQGWMKVALSQSAQSNILQVRGITLISTQPIIQDYLSYVALIDQPLDLAKLLALSHSSVSRTVCSCFRVTEQQIQQQLQNQKTLSLEALQDHLKCGTNCGSCLPEVNKLIASHQQSIDVVTVE